MSYDDESDCQIIGTPFPALEGDEIVSRKPEIDQTVRDEKGRRRFHGAFTGGFSAGYWNTVGSAEGFTPKIFISSRKDKYDKSGFTTKPEDYMDEEDFGSFGIAPKKIHTKDDFVENISFSSLKDTTMTFDEVIKSVFQPSKESIGKRLFRKMRRNAKLDDKDSRLIEDDLIAQKNEETLSYLTKFNRHGLGYKGMLNTDQVFNPESSKTSDKTAVMATMKSGRRLKIFGEAFGYGALEDDDAMDVYSTDDLSQYDFELGSQVKKSNEKKKFKISDSKEIQVEGFIKFKENISLFFNIKQKYGPPEIPKGWKPKKISKSFNKKSRWDTSDKPKKPEDKVNLEKTSKDESKSTPQKVLNANLRAVILGESLIHKKGVAKSSNDKELEFAKELNKPVVTPISIPKTPLSGFLASKFRSSAVAIEDEPLVAGLTKFENFSYTSTGKKTDDPIIKEETKTPVRTSYEWHPHKILCKRFGVQNPYPQFPDIVGIVCIGQNDKTRNMTVRLKTVNPKKSQSTNIFETLNLPSDSTRPKSISNQIHHVEPKEIEKASEENSQSLVVESTTNSNSEENQISESEPPPKPSIDLFKSIFASDEESEEEEESDEQKQNESSESLKDTPNRKSIAKPNGIFSGIDFDQLQNTFDPRLDKGLNETRKSQENQQIVDATVDDDQDCYGPALPPTVSNFDLMKLAKKSHKSKHKSNKRSKKKKSKKSKGKKRKKRSSSDSDSSQSSNSGNDNDDDNEIESVNGSMKDKLFELIKKVKHHHH